MDLTPTAQVVTSSTSIPLWLALGAIVSHVGAFVAGLFVKQHPSLQGAADLAGKIEKVGEKVEKLAPLAESVATMAGQPAVAAGIATGDAIATKAYEAIVQVHAQATAQPSITPSVPTPIPAPALDVEQHAIPAQGGA